MGETRGMMDFADHIVNAAKIAETLYHNRSHDIIDKIQNDEANAEWKRNTYIDIIARGIAVVVLEELEKELSKHSVDIADLVKTITSREFK